MSDETYDVHEALLMAWAEHDDLIARAEAAERRVAELEAQLRTLEAQAAYYGCPHCGKPITLPAPPIDPPAPA